MPAFHRRFPRVARLAVLVALILPLIGVAPMSVAQAATAVSSTSTASNAASAASATTVSSAKTSAASATSATATASSTTRSATAQTASAASPSGAQATLSPPAVPGGGLGALGFYPMQSFPLTDRMTVAVNLASGDLLVRATDLAVAGTGLPLVVDRWYNSQGTVKGGFGQWTMGTGEDVYLAFQTGGSKTFTLEGPSGFQYAFTPNPDGSFTSPPGLDATLAQVTGNPACNYVLTDQATGERLYFLGTGSLISIRYSHLVKIQDNNGNAIAFDYSTPGYVGGLFGPPLIHTMTDTQGRTVTFTYPQNANQDHAGALTMADSSGRLWRYGYPSGGADQSLTSATDPNTKTSQYAYSSSGDLTQIVDPNGNVTALQYDSSHRVTQITFGSGCAVAGTHAYTYNAGGTVVTDPNSHQATWAIDTQLRPTQVADALGDSQQWSWTADNHVQTSTDGYGQVTNFAYDQYNDLTQVTLPPVAPHAGVTTKATYGPVANIPYFSVPTSATDAQGNKTTYAPDGVGDGKAVTDALPGQNQASAVYNSNGTVASSADFDGNTTSYSYDSKGNLTKVTPPSPMDATVIVPDSLSRVSSVTDGKGQQTSYTYDPLDRVTLTGYADGSSIANNFDGDGNATSMVDGTGTTTYQYDARNRETLKTLPGNATVGHAYDAASNPTGLTDSGGTVAYAYNAGDELASLTEPGNLGTTTFAYDANHQRTSTTYPGGVVQTVTYDSSGRLATIGAKTGNGTQLTSFTYSYQKPGGGDGSLVTSITDGVDLTTTAQQYDAANRLTSWVVTPGQGSTFPALNYQYAFDGNGNRTSISANGTVTTLGYNAANEWMTATSGGQTAHYTYDPNGNELGNDGFGDPSKALKIAYNAQDQTTSVTDTQQNAIPMAYSGPGQAERTSAGWAASNPLTPNGPATYAYGSGLLNATDSAGTAYYTRDPGGTLISQRLPGGVVYHYLMSGDGSVVRLVDPSGNVVATYHYCPTGNASVPDSGPAAAGNPWRHFGLLRDASTDTDWLGNLRIDPESGNLSAPQFCLVLGGAFGFLCPRTSPAITQQQAQTQASGCPNVDENQAEIEGKAKESDKLEIHGFVRGPETDFGPQSSCHVNAEVAGAGGQIYMNFHVTYQNKLFVANGETIGTDPATAAEVVSPELAGYFSGLVTNYTYEQALAFFVDQATLRFGELERIMGGG